MRIFFISIFLLTHETIKDEKLIVEENVARFHRQHLVNATFLRDGYAATLEYFFRPAKHLFARHVGPAGRLVKILLAVRGRQAVVLGPQRDKFPTAVGAVAFPLGFGQPRCFGYVGGSWWGGISVRLLSFRFSGRLWRRGDKETRFRLLVAFPTGRHDGLIQVVGSSRQSHQEVIHISVH